MKTNYILIDYENVQVKSLALLKGEQFQVRVFLGPRNSKLSTEFVLAMRELGKRGDYIMMETNGNNALDFHIAYYLGRLAAKDSGACFYIISKDKGFDPLLDHLKKKKIECERAVSIEAMPCFSKTVVATTKPQAAKKVLKPDKLKADGLVEKVVANFQKREKTKPATEKTLKSTIKALCGPSYSEKELDAVFNRLVKKGLVKIDGMKVSYNLKG